MSEQEVTMILANNPNIVPVPVIASFNNKGEVIPLYFSVEGLRLRIDHLLYSNKKTLDVTSYRCEVTFSDRVQQITLNYHKNVGIWTLNKIS
ncbi:MAG: hypothetical protein IJZ82_12110 [Lachnospiraceae bacterium]|nr:hypothetical protein [Lachnospiraceae bacterium]